jgi:predicted CXXCH cytochrome family protein
LALLYLAIFAGGAPAAIHPVPLPRDATGDVCLQCHRNKTEGKHLHPAAAKGCLSCHLIRNSGETTRVNLKTAREATLCLGCHDGRQGSGNPGRAHSPTAQECTRCHDPHLSVNEHLLRKPASGEGPENLCLDCHQQIVQLPGKGSRHAALDSGCDTCHVTHKVGKGGEQEFDAHLTKAVPELCANCHDAKDAALIQAHQGQPVDGTRCTNCHDPHVSASPKLLQKQLHPVFGPRTCSTCHDAPKAGKVVLKQFDSRALCASCHPEAVRQMEAARVPHPGAAGECTQCHNPHAGKYAKLLQPGPVAVCEGCHAGQQHIHQTQKALHQPAFQQGCSVCHTPHGGDREHLLRAEANVLCLACHGRNAKTGALDGSSDVTIFGGAVRLPQEYMKQVTVLDLDEKGLGHPAPRHPVSAALDPTDPQKLRPISCLTCHTPHGGARGLLVTGVEAPGSLCVRCHPSVRTGATSMQVRDTTTSKKTIQGRNNP